MARKLGHVVTVSVQMSVESSQNYITVGTLPEGWRPDWYVVVPAYMVGDTQGVYIDITTGGIVHAQNAHKEGTLYGSVTYVAR